MNIVNANPQSSCNGTELLPTSVGQNFTEGFKCSLRELERLATTEVLRLQGLVIELHDEKNNLQKSLQKIVDDLGPCSSYMPALPAAGNAPMKDVGDDSVVIAGANSVIMGASSVALGANSVTVGEPPRVSSVFGGIDTGKEAMGAFVSVDQMDMLKLKFRQNKMSFSSDKCADSMYHKTGLWQKLVKHPVFEGLTMWIVIVNSVWISVDLDLNQMNPGNGDKTIFVVAEHLFCIFFLGELSARMLAAKNKLELCRDAWFIFDALLVALMVIESWLIPIAIALFVDSESGSVLANASLLRMLRLLRVTRMARTLRVIPELMLLINGMVTGLRAVGCTCLLLCAITYFFAVIFRQLTADTEMGKSFFSVPETIYYLLIDSILPDNGDTMNALRGDSVLCAVMAEQARKDKERERLIDLSTHLRRLYKEIDQNSDERITRGEVVQILNSESALRSLTNVGVDVCAFVDDLEHIFEHRELEDEGLDFDEFIEVVSDFRASSTASVGQMSGLKKLVETNFAILGGRLAVIEAQLLGGTAGYKPINRRPSKNRFDRSRPLGSACVHLEDAKQVTTLETKYGIQFEDANQVTAPETKHSIQFEDANRVTAPETKHGIQYESAQQVKTNHGSQLHTFPNRDKAARELSGLTESSGSTGFVVDTI